MRDAAGLGDAFRCPFFGPPLGLLEVPDITTGAGPTVWRVPACYDRGMGFIPLRLSSRFVLVFALLFVAGAEAEPVTVAAAGDVACAASEPVAPDACQMATTAKLIEQADPDAVLALGDLQYPAGTLADFRTSYDRTWGAFKTKTYPVPGNHEYGTPGAAGYYSYFGPRAGNPERGYYSFDLGDWHVVALNSECEAVGGCGADSPQGRWLGADLRAHPARCTLAFWHKPRFSSGLHGTHPQLRGLWERLEAAGAEVVLNAHDHLYERLAPQTNNAQRDPQGVRAFVAGAGGKSFYPALLPAPNREALVTEAFGVLFLTLEQAGYRWQYRTVDGEVRDAGRGTCH